MYLNSRSAGSAAAVLVALAACGQAEQTRSAPEGDIRGVEELASPDLTALNAADATFSTTTGVLAVALQASETLVVVSSAPPTRQSCSMETRSSTAPRRCSRSRPT